MASYLRPRRGKKATAIAQLTASAPLKRGEVFFEVPDAGIGTGAGKIKMGDGSTAYESLPYFLEPFDPDSATIGFTDASAAESDPYTTNATHANAIVPSANLKTIFTNLKQLLLNYNSQLTTLKNDLGGKQPVGSYAAANHNHNGVYQPVGSYAAANHNHNGVYQPAGSYAASSHTHDDRYYTESEINSKLNGKANSSHTHDDRYYTESEVETRISAVLKSTLAGYVGYNDLKSAVSVVAGNNVTQTLPTGNTNITFTAPTATGYTFKLIKVGHSSTKDIVIKSIADVQIRVHNNSGGSESVTFTPYFLKYYTG